MMMIRFILSFLKEWLTASWIKIHLQQVLTEYKHKKVRDRQIEQIIIGCRVHRLVFRNHHASYYISQHASYENYKVANADGQDDWQRISVADNVLHGGIDEIRCACGVHQRFRRENIQNARVEILQILMQMTAADCIAKSIDQNHICTIVIIDIGWCECIYTAGVIHHDFQVYTCLVFVNGPHKWQSCVLVNDNCCRFIIQKCR